MFRWLILAALCIPAAGQVMEISGGDSTLMDGAGGAVTAYLPNSTATISGGVADGHLAFGLGWKTSYRGADVTAGDSSFGYSVDNAGGLGIQVRGLTVSRQKDSTTFAAFAGLTGLGYSFPFFSAVAATHAGAGIYYKRQTSHLQLSGLAAFSGCQHTAVASAGYQSRIFHVAGAGGLLAGKKTATGVFSFQPSKHFNATALRQDLFWQGQQATINSASAAASFAGLSLNATALTGVSAGHHLTGESAGASFRLGATTLSSNIYESNGQRIFNQGAAEDFRHWHFSQSVSEFSGQKSLAFGGGYHGNRVSFSVGHSVEFLPFAARGFEQVTSVSVSFRIHDSSVNLATTILPTGPLYTASGDSFTHGPFDIQASQPRTRAGHHSSGGRYVITGLIVDKSGLPVLGATVTLGGLDVVSGTDGRFTARFRAVKAVTLILNPDEWATPGKWAVVAAPASAQPAPPESAAELRIVVERQP